MLEDLHHVRQQSIASIKRGIEWIKLPLQRFAQHPVIKSPYATLDIQKQKVEQMKRDLYQYMTWNVESLSQHALRLKDKLIALSPSRILERGYAIVTNASGKVLRSLDDISLGQTIKTQLKGGMITSTVQEKNTKE
jgi:exodeoxyribonuclease VII large subunit